MIAQLTKPADRLGGSGGEIDLAMDGTARSIVLQKTESEVIRTAAAAARGILRTDTSFAAIATGAETLPMAHWNGIRDPRWGEIVIRPYAGVGGQVLATGEPLSVDDYEKDPRISHEFLELVVDRAGLRSMVCVPVLGTAGTEALLYVASPRAGVLGGRAVSALKQLSTFAMIGLEQVRARELEGELARLRERERLASDLHDSVAQRLFAIGAMARHSQLQTPGSNGLGRILEEIDATAADARSELRDAIHRLNADPDERAFELRLDGELRLFESRGDCSIRLATSGEARPMPEHAEQLLCDTAIEGVRNAIKHADARLVAIELAYGSNWVSLVVQEEVAGDPATSAPDPGAGTGVGLATLDARAQRLGGSLMFAAGPKGNTVLKLSLPLHVAG